MAMEKGLCTQVLITRQNDSENIDQNENQNNITSKGNTQYQVIGLISILSI